MGARGVALCLTVIPGACIVGILPVTPELQPLARRVHARDQVMEWSAAPRTSNGANHVTIHGKGIQRCPSSRWLGSNRSSAAYERLGSPLGRLLRAAAATTCMAMGVGGDRRHRACIRLHPQSAAAPLRRSSSGCTWQHESRGGGHSPRRVIAAARTCGGVSAQRGAFNGRDPHT